MLQGDDRKAHRIALDHIEASLLNGKYKVGAKLPPERDLARELGVSRGAVREAIRVLQAQGILESHPGPGRGTRIIAGHTEALGRLFRLHLRDRPDRHPGGPGAFDGDARIPTLE